MSQRRVVVYAGPTISPEEVRAVLPEAEVRSPLARGDLLTAQWNPGDLAVVIDGYFRERRSVGHKEILWLLSQEVHVVGAASMGALRAVELAPYGMRGIGVVYEMYATYQIDGDDEVGVLHGPAEMGYPPQTVALVNLRYGCEQAAGTDLLSEAAGRRIVEAAKALPFTHRSWQDIEARLGEEDHGPLATFKKKIESGEWDVKHLDALSALRAVGTSEADAPQARSIEPTVLTGIAHNWVLAGQSVREQAPGKSMSDLDVLDAARLFAPEYPQLHERVLSGMLKALAEERGLTVAAYAQAKLGVGGGAPLPGPLASWLTPDEVAGLAPDQQLQLVMVRVWPIWHSPDWRPAILAELRASDRWHEWCEIVSQADDAAEEARYRLVIPSPTVCGKLFLRHWRRPDMSAEVGMARRGFVSYEELGRAVRRFFAYDLRRGRGAAKAAAGAGQAAPGS